MLPIVHAQAAHAQATPRLQPYRLGKFLLLLVLLGWALPSRGENTSAEANNPFNEFMSPSGGVNLFSGDVAFEHPLYTLQGRNGMQLPLVLNYSGNIHLNVRARNDKSPQEWIGLGWRFGFGNIRCDHNETGQLLDDRCFYVSPKGVSQEILEKDGTLYLEMEPFWSVQRAVSADGQRILGWTLTDVSGRKFKYGDFEENPANLRSATRYVFWWKAPTYPGVNFVGAGFSGSPALYPYQWDLAEEVDGDGNAIRYAYEQDQAQVRFKGTTLPVRYTRASYCRSITMDGGGSVEFPTQPKLADEVFDPDAFYPEPDAFVEFLEDRYLARIIVKNMVGTPIRSFRLVHEVANFQADRSAGYSKRLLTRIVEQGADGTVVGTHRFAYARENPEDESKPLGVLTEVNGPNCGKVKYFLERKQVMGTQKIQSFLGPGRFEKTSRIVGGRLNGGEEFVVITNGKDGEDKANEIFIFNNEDGNWKEYLLAGVDPPTANSRRLGLFDGSVVKIVAGDNCFAVVKMTSGDLYRVAVFFWDSQKWIRSDLPDVPYVGGAMPGIQIQKNIIAIIHSNSVETTVATFVRLGNGLYRAGITTIAGFFKTVILRGIHLMLVGSDPGTGMEKGTIQTWNGAGWSELKTLNYGHQDDSFVLGEHFAAAIMTRDGSVRDPHHAFISNWNGFAWQDMLDFWLDSKSYTEVKCPGSCHTESRHSLDIQGIGNGFAAFRSDDQDHLHLFQFAGEKWKKSFNRDMVRSSWDWFEANWHGDAYNDAFIVRTPRTKWKKFLGIPYAKELDRDAGITAFHRIGSRWDRKEFGLLGSPNTSKKVVVGQDFFAFNTTPLNAAIWDGTSWKVQDGERPFKKDALSLASGSLLAESADGEISLYRKFQNGLHNPVYSFVVTRKEVTDPVRGSKVSHRYEYDAQTGRYDIRAGTAKFHRVTAQLPEHGRKVFWFHNGSVDAGDQASLAGADRRLTGNLYREEEFSAAGRKTSERVRTLAVFRKEAEWPLEVRSIRLERHSEHVRKVGTSRIYAYHEANGLLSSVEEVGSAGRKRITRTLFAHEVPQYAGLLANGRHMLSQVAETKVYEGSADDANLRSCRVATWAPHGGSWHPVQTWDWAGTPAQAFTAFNFQDPSLNPKPWKLAGTVSGRDAHGRPVQETLPKGASTCVQFGHRGAFMVAKVQNAACFEVGLLTGDFSDPSPDLVDATNGWLRNQATISSSQVRFGDASLHVPPGSRGPEKRVGPVASGRDYVFSAWVYPVSVSASSPIALIVEAADGGEISTPGGRFGSLSPGSTHGWQRIQWKIPDSALTVPRYDIRLEAQGAADFYVQDIRFHPAGSLVTTQFLNLPYFLPAAIVSEAGSAQYFEYDGGMRLAKSFAENDQGMKVRRSEMEYHLDRCGGLQEARGTLAYLRSSAGHIPFDKTVRDYGELWVDPMTERVRMEFRAENPYEEVDIRVGGGDWNPPCCQGEHTADVQLSGSSTLVEVRAGTTGAAYKIALRKASTCWSPLGSQVSGGWAGRPASQQLGGEQWAAYRADQDGGRLRVKRRSSSAGAWTDVGGPISAGEVSGIVLKVDGGISYVAYLDEAQVQQSDGTVTTQIRAMIKRWDGTDWIPLQGDGGVSQGDARALAFDARAGNLWIAFIGNAAAEEGKDDGANPVYARKWNGSSWDPVRVVSEGSALDVSLAISQDGTPFIGYLGSIPFVNEGPGGPEVLRSGAVPMVKRWNSQDGQWFWGDLIPGTDGRYTSKGEVWNLPQAGRLQLAFSGSDLLMALSYAVMKPLEDEPDAFVKTGENLLEVRKFRGETLFSDGSHWFPLSSGIAPGEYAVGPMDEDGDFHLSATGANPTLAFVSTHNRQRITVVEFTAGRWTAVGLPGIMPVDPGFEPGRISVAAASGASTIALLRQDDPTDEASRHVVRAIEYTGSCPDLALSNLMVLEGTQQVPFEWAFKPYLLLNRGTVSAQATAISLHLTPSNLAALSKVWVGSPDGSVQEWSSASGNPFPAAFPVTLRERGNNLWVELLSADGHHRLRYDLELRRSPQTATGGIVLIRDVVLHPSFTVDNPGPYTVLVPADKPSIQASVDVPSNVGVFVNGRPLGRGEVMEVLLSDGTTYVKVVLVGEDGVRREYDIQVDRGTPSAGVAPRLDGVTQNPDGSFTARFGFVNPNSYERRIPVSSMNMFRYRGGSGLDLGQPTLFSAGTVSGAFSVAFDGTPLTWHLDGQSVTATASQAPNLVQVEMQENALAEPNISKPQLRLTNLSQDPLSGFKVTLWLSRAEVPYQEIVADPYYFQPSGIQMTVGFHPGNENLVRVDLLYPSDFVLAPGASTDGSGAQLGVHFRNYYPGQWDRANDWSWQGIGPTFTAAPHVTVYAADGSLLAGTEPDPGAIPSPPPLTQAAVFTMDAVWPWQIDAGAGLSPNLVRRTQGAAALEVEGAGYLQMTHLPMKTLDISGEEARLLVDFYLPSGQSNPWWKGQVQLVADCPTAGLQSAYIGQVELTPLPDGSFSTLSFPLPAQILDVLRGDWRDFRFKWVLNINPATEKPVLDNMRFAP